MNTLVTPPQSAFHPQLFEATLFARIGGWLGRNRDVIAKVQWCVIALYAVLVAFPAFLPLPERHVHMWNNLTLAAQFMFWGIWWPFVLVSMIVFGRAWCGLLCPEGALSEFVSRYGHGRSIPRWMTWPGWPFVAFATTTIYGQLVSVYQYPKPALLILGGSTAAAVAIGFLYGRNLRVWCRFLCPVNGVFNLLAKLAPIHFRVDAAAWRASHERGEHPKNLHCAPLVPVRNMTGAGQCHMCGRCSGFRSAVQLAPRLPNHEIVNLADRHPHPWETALIFFGMLGLALGAFRWTNSSLFVELKQTLATWLVQHQLLWPLQWSAPWWLLTNYPGSNDVMNLIDGVVLLTYLIGTALLMGGALYLVTALATRSMGAWSSRRFHHIAQCFIPLAGCGVFLGLSALTVTQLRAEHLNMSWASQTRDILLALSCIWSGWLAWRVISRHARGARRFTAALLTLVGIVATGFVWRTTF
ncbi:MAG: 4Fe-4S binding protein [Gammaproteobacteria bacterium]